MFDKKVNLAIKMENGNKTKYEQQNSAMKKHFLIFRITRVKFH